MAFRSFSQSSGNVWTDLGIQQSDIEVAKADLATRIQRLIQHRRLTSDEAATLLNIPKPELPALFQGRLATCSLDQLLRILMHLGDDIEITIRPRLQRTRRGSLRVLQAAAVERPEDFEPVRLGGGTQLWTRRLDASDEKPGARAGSQGIPTGAKDDTQLLNKHAVEKMTSLDITTIYRKMAAGKFPQPVKVGRRRVAWRTSDIVRWQQGLEVGTETAKWRAGRGEDNADSRPTARRGPRQPRQGR